jgi:ABC-type uncharacterized transport system substrate-binding protein
MEYLKILTVSPYRAGCDRSNCLRLGARHVARRLTLALLILFFNTELYAARTDILVLKSGQESVYTDIVETVTAHLQDSCEQQTSDCTLPSIKIVSLSKFKTEEEKRLLNKQWRLIITVGGKAAARVAEKSSSTPVLHTVLPRKTFEFIYQNKSSRKASAIFIDQPLVRKLALIREAMPERKRVGILITESSSIDRAQIQRTAAEFGLTIQFGIVDSEREIGNTLREMLEQSDVLLALPDPAIFNQRTVKNILLSSYHNRVPVVGFSLAYVKAGAIAAVYSSPEEIGKHIGEWVGRFLRQRGAVTPTRTFPKYFSVSTNKSVADSLKILVPAAGTLESKLEERGL